MAPADTTTAPSSSPPGRTRHWRRWTGLEVLALVLVAAVAVSLLRHLVVQVYAIPSGSMEPLLGSGDRVVVTRLDDDVRRGDVVVFDGAGLFASGAPAGEQDFVKRVVGVGGDRVVCCDRDGRLSVDGKPLEEPYLFAGDDPSETAFDVEVPIGRLWLMGDHRSGSADSRAHLGSPGGGMVPQERVVGRVVAVVWPPDRARTVGRLEHEPATADDEGTR